MTKAQPVIDAFADEERSVEREGVTVENRTDEVVIYGDTSIPRTTAGLRRALFLRAVLDDAIAALERDPALPDELPPAAAPEIQDNPF